MANIDIGGRLHSTATGNVVAGADEILDDFKGKKQSVINAEVTATLAEKQDSIADLSTIRSGAASGATAYQKPSGGIPKVDLASGIQGTLDLADSAIQSEPIGSITPPVNPSEYATKEGLGQLDQKVTVLSEDATKWYKFDLSSFEQKGFTILTTDKYGTNETTKHIAIPASPKYRYSILAPESVYTRYAFVKSNNAPVADGDIDLCSGSHCVEISNEYEAIVTAPDDAVSLLILLGNFSNSYQYTPQSVKEEQLYITPKQTQNRLDDVEPKVGELRDDVGERVPRNDLSVSEWTDGQSISSSDGSIGNSGVNSITNKINVSGKDGKTLVYTRKKITGTSVAGLAFYGDDDSYLSGEAIINNASESGYELSPITIPQGASYVRFTFGTSDKSNFEAYVIEKGQYLSGLGKRVQDLESETESINEDIAELGAAINAPDADKNEKIFPVTTMGELQSGVIATSYSSEYAVVNVKKYRGKKIFVNNLHSATGESQILDGADNVLATFSGEGTSVGVITIPADAVKMIVSNDFLNNQEFYISVPSDVLRNVGLIFGENFLSDYDEGDFSQFNGSVVTDKGLQLPGTGASNGLILNKVVALDNWSLVAEVMTDDNTEAVSLGTKMTQPGITHHSTRVSVDFGAGTISLYNNHSDTLVTSASVSSIVNGNIYTIRLERVDRAIYATLFNRKTGASVSVNSQDGAEGSGNEGTNPAGKMFDSPVFYVGGGSPYLQNFYATCLRNAKVLFVGDSITAGAHTTWEKTWSAKAAGFFGNSLTGGRGSGQVFCCLNQLRSLIPIVRPKAVVVTIGTNFTSGISKIGYKGLFLSIVNVIRNYGAIPIINNVCACDSRKTNLTTINEVVNELKQIGCRFDLATSLNNNWADGQDTQYYYTDNVHLNDAGNTLLYNIVTSQLGWLKDI